MDSRELLEREIEAWPPDMKNVAFSARDFLERVRENEEPSVPLSADDGSRIVGEVTRFLARLKSPKTRREVAPLLEGVDKLRAASASRVDESVGAVAQLRRRLSGGSEAPLQAAELEELSPQEEETSWHTVWRAALAELLFEETGAYPADLAVKIEQLAVATGYDRLELLQFVVAGVPLRDAPAATVGVEYPLGKAPGGEPTAPVVIVTLYTPMLKKDLAAVFAMVAAEWKAAAFERPADHLLDRIVAGRNNAPDRVPKSDNFWRGVLREWVDVYRMTTSTSADALRERWSRRHRDEIKAAAKRRGETRGRPKNEPQSRPNTQGEGSP